MNTPTPLALAGVLLAAAVAAGGPLPAASADEPVGQATAVAGSDGCDDGHRRSSESDGRLLVVADADTGEGLLAVPVADGTRVALAYTHSVEKTRVVDGYAVRGDRLEMVRMEFSSYGAGLPARADVERTPNGTFVFDPPGTYRELYVTPGRIADHVLRVDGRRYDLVSLSNASTVRLHVAPGCERSADPGVIAGGGEA